MPLPPSIRIIVSLFHCCSSHGGSYSKWIHVNGIPLPSLPRHFVRWICNVPWTNFSSDERWKKRRRREAGQRYGRKRKRSRRNARGSEILSDDSHALSHRRPLSDSLIIYSVLTKHRDQGYTEIRIHRQYNVTFSKIITSLYNYIMLYIHITSRIIKYNILIFPSSNISFLYLKKVACICI